MWGGTLCSTSHPAPLISCHTAVSWSTLSNNCPLSSSLEQARVIPTSGPPCLLFSWMHFLLLCMLGSLIPCKLQIKPLSSKKHVTLPYPSPLPSQALLSCAHSTELCWSYWTCLLVHVLCWYLTQLETAKIAAT